VAYSFPVFSFNPNRVWPEVPSCVQETSEVSRLVNAAVILTSYLISGGQLRGSYEGYTLQELSAELDKLCTVYNLDSGRLVAWAQSIILPPEYVKSIPAEEYMPELGIKLHQYQRREAEWMASRRGGVFALSCGTGKSVTAWAAARAAVVNGTCSNERLSIVCPVNAVGQWGPYVDNLKNYFKEVGIYSVDSMHKTKHVPRVGGALIVDEVHKCKNTDSSRTLHTFEYRLGFDWCACLTGTLLHTGPEGSIHVQDLAVPGLSRFTNKWKFGEVFNCIVKKNIGSSVRRSLAIPSGESFEAFVKYLSRGVRSLSFDSPEVKKESVLPGQTKHAVDTWEEPEWVKLAREEDRREIKKLNPTLDKQEVANREKLFWLPYCNGLWGLGATALCIMDEWNELRKLGLNADREKISEEDEIGEITLPHIAKARMEISREGRIDRCVEKTSTGYKWRYAPGSDLLNPAPGPKIKYVMNWVDMNEGEPALLGAVSSLSKNFLIKGLEERGKKFKVIDGTTDSRLRSEYTRMFQTGEIDYMVVQQVAGSESITLTRACNSFLVDHALSPIVYTQYLARVSRTGQQRECDHYDLVFGEYQTHIVKALQRGEAFDTNVRSKLEELLAEGLKCVKV
jgi:hypothetical protein